ELRDGLLIARSSVEALAGELQAGGPMTFSIAEFKARFGLSRKWAIPLLERLDADGVTRRRGDLREVLAAEPAGAEDRPASG
ncbi:MAG: SelB C-terminal domain-containing protein, partial [Acidobacteriota bacterium]